MWKSLNVFLLSIFGHASSKRIVSPFHSNLVRLSSSFTLRLLIFSPILVTLLLHCVSYSSSSFLLLNVYFGIFVIRTGCFLRFFPFLFLWVCSRRTLSSWCAKGRKASPNRLRSSLLYLLFSCILPSPSVAFLVDSFLLLSCSSSFL